MTSKYLQYRERQLVRRKTIARALTLLKNLALAAGWLGLAVGLLGCAGHDSLGQWSGPKQLAVMSVDADAAANPPCKTIRTQHYLISTTIMDRPDLLDRMGQLMEGAFAVYQSFVPGITSGTRPMECHLFATRNQWAQFTEAKTGMDANIYLKISRGAYTIRDWFVAYYIGDIGTYSVAAHEGWHQFANRHFKGRLPPFLEEGMACMFEDVQWDGDLPRFNLSMNPARAQSLRKAVDEGQLFPLEQLVTLHAGEIVNMSDVKIEAFYGQDWAFARYLWEGENGRFRPALLKLLADTADGTVQDPTGSLRRSYLPWNPAGVRPMLEHYLGEDFAQIEKGYREFINKVAFDEMKAQFQM